MKNLIKIPLLLSKPDFDGLKTWVYSDYIRPIIEACQYLAPFAAVAFVGISWLVHVFKSENGKQQQPFGDIVKNTIIGVALVEVIGIVLNYLFGASV